ncbi:MAG: hypothetical protein U1C74_26585 [Phenylobacterium sp.]|nr:hypothetical protein [Phenylobacterium sp.]
MQIAHLAGVLGRDDEAEMMPIGFAPIGEGAPVHIFALGVEQPSGGAVTAGSVALQVAEVGGERRGAKPAAAMTRDASLDEDPASGTAQRRPRAGEAAAPEGRTPAARSGEARAGMAGALGGAHHLSDEALGLAPGRAAVPDPSRPDMKIAVALAHAPIPPTMALLAAKGLIGQGK